MIGNDMPECSERRFPRHAYRYALDREGLQGYKDLSTTMSYSKLLGEDVEPGFVISFREN